MHYNPFEQVEFDEWLSSEEDPRPAFLPLVVVSQTVSSSECHTRPPYEELRWHGIESCGLDLRSRIKQIGLQHSQGCRNSFLDQMQELEIFPR